MTRGKQSIKHIQKRKTKETLKCKKKKIKVRKIIIENINKNKFVALTKNPKEKKVQIIFCGFKNKVEI